MTDKRELTGIEKIAAGASIAVLASATVYWLFQVAAVIELLQMAYG
jgi:hypothetical protein